MREIIMERVARAALPHLKKEIEDIVFAVLEQRKVVTTTSLAPSIAELRTLATAQKEQQAQQERQAALQEELEDRIAALEDELGLLREQIPTLIAKSVLQVSEFTKS